MPDIGMAADYAAESNEQAVPVVLDLQTKIVTYYPATKGLFFELLMTFNPSDIKDKGYIVKVRSSNSAIGIDQDPHSRWVATVDGEPVAVVIDGEGCEVLRPSTA